MADTQAAEVAAQQARTETLGRALALLRDPDRWAREIIDRPNSKSRLESTAKRSKPSAFRRSSGRWNGKGSAIIYCPTVKMVKALHRWLKSLDYAVGKYHGKCKRRKREKAQAHFMVSKTRIMVATNTFGLGIDKPVVRLIIHAGLPLSLDGYVQEIGRAGRDGKKAKCVLLYAKSDFTQNKRILRHGGKKKVVARRLKRLHALRRLLNKDQCLRRDIEQYFGQKSHKKCEKCCNCRKKRTQ